MTNGKGTLKVLVNTMPFLVFPLYLTSYDILFQFFLISKRMVRNRTWGCGQSARKTHVHGSLKMISHGKRHYLVSVQTNFCFIGLRLVSAGENKVTCGKFHII